MAASLGEAFSVPLFKALSEPSRLAIVLRLAAARDPLTVGDIAKWCPLSVSVVSRHLAQLKAAGLLHSERRGREVYYSFRAAWLAEHLRAIADLLDACCDPANQTPDPGASTP